MSWLGPAELNFNKIDKKKLFINSKLDSIVSQCKIHPVISNHVQKNENLSDAVTRCLFEFFTKILFSGDKTLLDHQVKYVLQVRLWYHPLGNASSP